MCNHNIGLSVSSPTIHHTTIAGTSSVVGHLSVADFLLEAICKTLGKLCVAQHCAAQHQGLGMPQLCNEFCTRPVEVSITHGMIHIFYMLSEKNDLVHH